MPSLSFIIYISIILLELQEIRLTHARESDFKVSSSTSSTSRQAFAKICSLKSILLSYPFVNPYWSLVTFTGPPIASNVDWFTSGKTQKEIKDEVARLGESEKAMSHDVMRSMIILRCFIDNIYTLDNASWDLKLYFYFRCKFILIYCRKLPFLELFLLYRDFSL